MMTGHGSGSGNDSDSSTACAPWLFVIALKTCGWRLVFACVTHGAHGLLVVGSVSVLCNVKAVRTLNGCGT